MIDEPTRLIVARHGETDWNVDQRIQGQLDIPLNAHGRWQAAQLAQALADEGIDAIYSSDLQRAAETASAIGAHAGRAVVHDSGLRERAFGHFEGVTFREIGQRWPEAQARWRAREPAFAPGDGETLIDFQARVVQTTLRLAERHAGAAIALVAHGGVLDCLYRAAANIALDAPRTWQLGNATVNRLLFAGGRLALVGWNDARHLEGGGPAAVES